MDAGVGSDGVRALAFEPGVEADFLHAWHTQATPIVRWGLVLGIALYAVFGILDGYVLPETHATARLIRFAFVIPAVLAVLGLTYSRLFERFAAPIVVGVSLVLAGGILAMMHFSHQTEPGFRYYYTGLMLVIIWVGTFAQLRFKHVALTIALILAAYVWVAVASQRMLAGGLSSPSAPLFINNSFFLIGSAILAVFSSYAFEVSKRQTFLQTRIIAEEKARTQTLLEKIDTLFGQQVSEEVADELVSGTAATESRLVDVTVMFCDIRDFTRLADSRDPHQVAVFQNTVFGALIDIVREEHGIINQMLGDGIMATFGAPTRTNTHPTDAVVAALRVVETIERLGSEGKIPPIRVGIGLHTGQVLAGNIGNELRKQYSLAGKTVIIAARIEQLNKIYDSQILISDATLAAIDRERFRAEDMGEVQHKGIEQPIRVHRLA